MHICHCVNHATTMYSIDASSTRIKTFYLLGYAHVKPRIHMPTKCLHVKRFFRTSDACGGS